MKCVMHCATPRLIRGTGTEPSLVNATVAPLPFAVLVDVFD